jgi:Lrp/AsnC family leucine-responsive transcriptional regulator
MIVSSDSLAQQDEAFALQLRMDFRRRTPHLAKSLRRINKDAGVNQRMALDDTDRRILRVLQRKGRISNAELAEDVNLSASACHRRVQRLEADGYIRDYVALLNARKLGMPTTVFVEIKLSSQADDLLEAFEKAVSRVPDVLECHLMAGTADYILKVVAEDTDDFARIHRQYLTRLPGVAQMQSSFALRTVFKTTALPV